MIPKISTVAFCCALVCLVAGLAWTISTRRSISIDLDRLGTELNELKHLERTRDTLRQRASQDAEIITRVLRQCRTAQDIPKFGGHRILSNQVNADSVLFYVPEGNHRLEIHTSWKPGGNVNSTAPLSNSDAVEVDTTTDETLTGELSWTIPLHAEHGYRFIVTGELGVESPVGWELSSNANAFATSTEMLPLPPSRNFGGSWSPNGLTSFPNQINVQMLSRGTGIRGQVSPLTIGKWTRRVAIEKKIISIEFELQLTSDNDPVISATDAENFLSFRQSHRISDYLDDGRYRVVD